VHTGHRCPARELTARRDELDGGIRGPARHVVERMKARASSSDAQHVGGDAHVPWKG
jgi:hypothetical protein